MTKPDKLARRADPTAREAAAIVAEVFGEPAATIVRFSIGSSHFVYDARLASGRTVVVRLSRPEHIEEVRGAVYWSHLLRPKGVPLPDLLHADLSMMRHPFPLVVLERLPGKDLGMVYPGMSRTELRALAERLVSIQSIVTALPPGGGF